MRRARNGVRLVGSPIAWPDAFLTPDMPNGAGCLGQLLRRHNGTFRRARSRRRSGSRRRVAGQNEKAKLAINQATLSRNGGSACDRNIDDDGRSDDARPNRRALPADIPRRAANTSFSCRPWFSPRRERRLHTDASHPGCMPAEPRPERPYRPGKKQTRRPAMQARTPNGYYACGYPGFKSDPEHVLM